MKVRELVSHLMEADQDLEVVVTDFEGRTDEIVSIELVDGNEIGIDLEKLGWVMRNLIVCGS